MKRFCLLLTTVFLCLLFASCRINDNDNDVNDNDNDDIGKVPEDAVIFGDGVKVNFVVRDVDGEVVTDMMNVIYPATGEFPVLVDDESNVGEHELVFGDTARKISADAKATLEKKIDRMNLSPEELDDLCAYCVYSDGSSVAVVWTDAAAREEALNYFSSNYLNHETLALKKGYFKFNSFSYIGRLREEEAAYRETLYSKIEEDYGAETLKAVKAHMSIYDEQFYLWLADLYEPGEYGENGEPLGGGFYYSNSARNNYGYLIDIESTEQALSFLVSSGMIRHLNDDLSVAIPERMQKEMIAFALSLQSSADGYFYHPQWGINISIARKSRDLGWATKLLGHFGYKPYWNAPDGTEGTYGAPGANAVMPSSCITGRLSSASAVTAVSKVIAVSDTSNYIEQLQTIERWVAYLEGYRDVMDEKSYSLGHEIAEQVSQLREREKIAVKSREIGTDGRPIADYDGDGVADNGFVMATKRFFDSTQNNDNGLWEPTVNYGAVNGLMKICHFYKELSVPINFAKEAVASAIEVICLEGEDNEGAIAANSVDIYNPWIAISRILNIVKNANKDMALCENIRDFIKQDAAEMIKITTAKTVKFKKDDGSFGYTQRYSPSKSQGSPVAVPNTVEGDINGGCIAVTGVTNNMFSVLGIDLPIYYRSDFEQFIKRAYGHGVVIKDPIDDPEPFTFEDEGIGSKTAYGVTHYNTAKGEGYIEVVSVPDGAGQALRCVTYPETGDHVTFDVKRFIEKKSCYVLEFDILFTEIIAGSSSAYQITMDGCYMFILGVTPDGKLSFSDSSTTSSENKITTAFKTTTDAFSWHKIRLEHYLDVDGLPRTKLFLDGTLIGVSINYYGKQAGERNTSYEKINFYSFFSTNCVMYLDNVYAESTNKKYVDETPTGGTVITDPTLTVPDKYIFDGDGIGGTLPAGVTHKNSSTGDGYIEVVDDPRGEGKVLEFATYAGTGDTVEFKTKDTEENNCYVLEFDILFKEINAGSSAAYQITMDRCYMLILGVTTDGKLSFSDSSTTSSDNKITTVFKTTTNAFSWHKIRLEHYLDVDGLPRTKLFLDGTLIGVSTNYYGKQAGERNTEYTKFKFYSLLSTDCVVYLDNVYAESNDEEYVDETPTGGAIITDPTLTVPDKYIFDGDGIGGTLPAGITHTNSSTGDGYIEVVDDPRGDGKALEFTTYAGTGDHVKFKKKDTEENNCYVLEFDMCFSQVNKSGGVAYQIRLGYAYMLTISVTAGGQLSFGDMSGSSNAVSTSFERKFDAYAWHTVRVEHYLDVDGAPITKIFVDEDLVGKSDNYFGKEKDSRNTSYDHVNFYAVSSIDASLLIDNLSCESNTNTYTDSEKPQKD